MLKDGGNAEQPKVNEESITNSSEKPCPTKDNAKYNTQISDLKKELICLHQSIDVEKLLRKNRCEKIEQRSATYEAVLHYVGRCIDEKELEYKHLMEGSMKQDNLFHGELEQHEAILARKRKETNLIKSRISSDRLVFVKKIAEMKPIKEEREQLMLKYAEIKRIMHEKPEEHNQVRCELDIQYSAYRNSLQSEMEERVAQLAEEFRTTTKQREEKLQVTTLYTNATLFQRLYELGTKLQKTQDRNKLLLASTGKVRQEIELSQSMKTQMQKKLVKQFKTLLTRLKECKSHEEAYAQLENSNAELASGEPGAFKSISKAEELRERRQVLLNTLRAEELELQDTKALRGQLNQTLTSEIVHLKQLTVTRENLTSLLMELTKAFTQAKELFDPKKIISHNERSIRKQRLLAAFFALLYMTDRVCRSVKPRQLGIAGVTRQASGAYLDDASQSEPLLANNRKERINHLVRPKRLPRLGTSNQNTTHSNETRSLVGQLSQHSQSFIGRNKKHATNSRGIQATPTWLRQTMSKLNDLLDKPNASKPEKMEKEKRRHWSELDCNICGQLFSVPET